MTAPTALVRRLVDDVINGGDVDLLDELCTPSLAPKLRWAFGEFRCAFPDWYQEVREFVTDGHTVVARMRCTGIHAGQWQGLAPTGRPMRVDAVYFFRVADDRITGLWGLEDTWTRMRHLAGDNATLGELGSLSWPRRPAYRRSVIDAHPGGDPGRPEFSPGSRHSEAKPSSRARSRQGLDVQRPAGVGARDARGS